MSLDPCHNWRPFDGFARPLDRDDFARPGLDRRARSIVVLSVCVANAQWDEFRLHLRGALNNGLTRDEIKEILIQCAVYASVPAANHAFKEAEAFFKEAGV